MVTARRRCEADGMQCRALFLWVTLVAGALASSPSCNSPLKVRRDAGTNPDASARPDGETRLDAAWPDAAQEVPAAEVAVDRGSTLDQAARSTPTGFRIVNHTDQTYYFNVTADVSCSKEQPPGEKTCFFFHDWALFDCTAIPSDRNCCVFAERPIPSVLPIPAGEERFIPWSGVVYGRTAGSCAQCECQQPLPEQEGGYVASIQISTSYACWETPGCKAETDGTITGAFPQGYSSVIKSTFINPSTVAEVVFPIGPFWQSDAGVADLGSPDAPTPDLLTYDRGPDSALAAFPELPGNTFAIAASATAPDAGTSGGDCRPSDRNAAYTLQFSADGQKVHIVRTDPVQEVMMDGELRETVAGILVYVIDNRWAGAQLIVRREATTLVAQLVVFGSGVPVVSCIEAPMTIQGSGPG
jgi:hypothetical protein